MMTLERRGATRYNFGAIAEVINLASRDEVVGVTRDLSLWGCFIKTTTPFPEGTKVSMKIASSGAQFAATGRVTSNVTPLGMGIEFVEIALNDQAIIEKWLSTSSAKGEQP
jgi:hypothetical protein